MALAQRAASGTETYDMSRLRSLLSQTSIGTEICALVALCGPPPENRRTNVPGLMLAARSPATHTG
jgi:hypothetical protein